MVRTRPSIRCRRLQVMVSRKVRKVSSATRGYRLRDMEDTGQPRRGRGRGKELARTTKSMSHLGRHSEHAGLILDICMA